jgi:catechol 2,3-dioxygenase-like lactoylglutathione lyase family enzyme
MLADHPIDVLLLATDLDAAKTFYRDKVGLPLLMESPHVLSFGCGGDSRLFISLSTVGTADEQTQAAWRVTDLAAEVAELRARGVKIEDYDTPELRTVDGIADIGFALMAWFIDPAKNCVGLTQFR